MSWDPWDDFEPGDDPEPEPYQAPHSRFDQLPTWLQVVVLFVFTLPLRLVCFLARRRFDMREFFEQNC